MFRKRKVFVGENRRTSVGWFAGGWNAPRVIPVEKEGSYDYGKRLRGGATSPRDACFYLFARIASTLEQQTTVRKAKEKIAPSGAVPGVIAGREMHFSASNQVLSRASPLLRRFAIKDRLSTRFTRRRLSLCCTRMLLQPERMTFRGCFSKFLEMADSRNMYVSKLKISRIMPLLKQSLVEIARIITTGIPAFQVQSSPVFHYYYRRTINYPKQLYS